VKTVRANAGPWIVGTLLALIGVALARLVAPTLAGHARLLATLGGQLLGLGGLFVICLGVRRRLRAASS
jgi:hypothetical protein